MSTDFSPLVQHGGNLTAARAAFPDAPTPWLDLSTGINPIAYPLPELPASAWQRLPDPADLAALESDAARAYGVPHQAEVAAAPGTQAIIQVLPRLLAAHTVGILGRTYAEHAAAWRAAGARVETVEGCEDLRAFDAAVVVNPNNPDGRLVRVDVLRSLTAHFEAKGGALVVDEAFVDVLDPSASLVPHLRREGALVLRSFGKTYGLAGLRLGFAIGGAGHLERLRRMFGPWAVSGPAILVGRAALRDEAWLETARARLMADAQALDGILLDKGFAVEGGTPLFRLASVADAPRRFVRLADAGILVRPFAAQPSWLRFGVPRTEADRSRLAAAL